MGLFGAAVGGATFGALNPGGMTGVILGSMHPAHTIRPTPIHANAFRTVIESASINPGMGRNEIGGGVG